MLVLLVFPSFIFFGIQGYSRFMGGEHQTVADRRPDPVALQRPVDRLPGGGEHVPQQEHEDPDGQGVEQRPDADHGRPYPPDRQSDKDGEPGHGAQQGDPGTRHARSSGRRSGVGQP